MLATATVAWMASAIQVFRPNSENMEVSCDRKENFQDLKSLPLPYPKECFGFQKSAPDKSCNAGTHKFTSNEKVTWKQWPVPDTS
jgi:hypothetical protein